MEISDLQNSFYPNMMKSGGLSRREEYRQFKRRWLQAGAPKHYHETWVKGKGTQRVWDLQARAERLLDRTIPGRASVRRERAELLLRRNNIIL